MVVFPALFAHLGTFALVARVSGLEAVEAQFMFPSNFPSFLQGHGFENRTKDNTMFIRTSKTFQLIQRGPPSTTFLPAVSQGGRIPPGAFNLIKDVAPLGFHAPFPLVPLHRPDGNPLSGF